MAHVREERALVQARGFDSCVRLGERPTLAELRARSLPKENGARQQERDEEVPSRGELAEDGVDLAICGGGVAQNEDLPVGPGYARARDQAVSRAQRIRGIGADDRRCPEELNERIAAEVAERKSRRAARPADERPPPV